MEFANVFKADKFKLRTAKKADMTSMSPGQAGAKSPDQRVKGSASNKRVANLGSITATMGTMY